MIESFVDLTYRGLPLGRRIKLTAVRPTTGYLELPMPMPVGTQIVISTDENVTLEATVLDIHEQVAGSERTPGMTVQPALAEPPAQSWWNARVALPTEAPAPERAKPVTVRPRSHTVPNPIAAGSDVVTTQKMPTLFESKTTQPMPPMIEAQPVATEVTATKELSVYVAEPPAATVPKLADLHAATTARPKLREEDIKRTAIMPAVDQELLAKLTQNEGEVENLVRRTGEHEVVDDGLRTTVMDAVDPAALGLDVSASGSFQAAQSGEISTDDDGEDDGGDAGGSASASDKPKPASGGGKKRKKRR